METITLKMPKLQMTEINENKKSKKQQVKERQTIAIWGSPGSGKTTLAIRIAKQLANKKKNVILVHDDIFCPMLPTFFPTLDKEEEKSLGAVLTSPMLDQNVIMDHLVLMKHNDYIAFLGHQKGENPLTYAEYTKERVVDLFLLLRHLADYVIIDCSSIITESILTITALEMADQVIRLSTADFKGLSYFKSTLPLLIDQKFNTESHLRIVSNIKEYQADQTVNNVLRGANIFLPYTQEIEMQHAEGTFFENLNQKRSRKYNQSLKQIIKEVFYE